MDLDQFIILNDPIDRSTCELAWKSAKGDLELAYSFLDSLYFDSDVLALQEEA